QEHEFDAAWVQGREMCWQTRRQVLNLTALALQGLDAYMLDELVAQWVSTSRTNTPEKPRARWLLHVAELLNHDPSLSLTDLSRAVGVVPAYLSAEFSRTHGQTVSSYRRQIMLNRALR